MPPTGAASPIAPPQGVDLWTVPLEQPAGRDVRLIAACSPQERARAAGMRVARRRRDFLVGRGIVRSILGAYLGIPPCRVAIAAGPFGKPFVDAPGAPAFNVSHSGGLAVLAVTAGFEVGVDVERVDRRLDVAAIARRFLSPQEASLLAALGADARVSAFFRIWTRKEARLKASGTGFGAASPARAARARRGAADTRTLTDLVPARGYLGALAYDGPPAHLNIPDHALACL